MQAVLARARPLIEVLIERELARNDAATPERRAAIERDVRVLIARIEDATVRAHYQQAVLERLAALWGGRGHGRRQGENTQLSRSGLDGSRRRHGQGFRPQPGHGQPLRRGASFEEPRPRASESLKRSALVAGQEAGRPSLREALILKCVLNHPWLLEEEAERLAELPFAQPALDRLRTALLSLQAGDTPLDRQSVAAQLAALDLTKVVELVERAVTHNCDRFAAIGTARNEVEMGWRHSLALHERLVGLRWALAAEERHWHDSGSEDALARIREIKQQMAALEAAEAQSSDVVL
jgi:DNA primase